MDAPAPFLNITTNPSNPIPVGEPTANLTIGGGFNTILDPTGSQGPQALPGAFTVNISNQWFMVCNLSLAIYTMLLYIFANNLWHSISVAGDAWAARIWQRRTMTSLSMVQTLLGTIVMAWIVTNYFRLSEGRLADGLVIIIGQRLSENAISTMLLIKAYHVRNRNRYILGIGVLLLLANLVMSALECATIPKASTRWGWYAVQVAATLATGIPMILNMVMNLYVTGCFLRVIRRHARITTSVLYTALIRDGTQFALVCAITNVVVGILFLTRAVGTATPSVLYHVGWTIQSWLMVRQLESARRSYAATTIKPMDTGVSGNAVTRISDLSGAGLNFAGGRKSTATMRSVAVVNKDVGPIAASRDVVSDDAEGDASLPEGVNPLCTYLPPGAHGSATPQHHAKSPTRSAMRPLRLPAESFEAYHSRAVSFVDSTNSGTSANNSRTSFAIPDDTLRRHSADRANESFASSRFYASYANASMTGVSDTRQSSNERGSRLAPRGERVLCPVPLASQESIASSRTAATEDSTHVVPPSSQRDHGSNGADGNQGGGGGLPDTAQSPRDWRFSVDPDLTVSDVPIAEVYHGSSSTLDATADYQYDSDASSQSDWAGNIVRAMLSDTQRQQQQQHQQ
ncbi:hypothetical protein THASP1DRAFT_31674 [Thamnocephalis sphaerospora]|uniref:Uncharacterized protein n=1 Tax=Thamnocephalis sphaerospora TaxID=78915 RepID=A0A4P9XMC0_9FUNG|nr:hypothetical protein THASP1DRAFT_31674 [Thamnocephalis sphaerospora]|eukprot:RKP06511.1 hypothetical protein THASP1DRAFT_31674 [Thamnocephalis sphaerospora]